MTTLEVLKFLSSETVTDNVNGWRQQRPTEKENFTPVKTSVRRHERPTDIAKLS